MNSTENQTVAAETMVTDIVANFRDANHILTQTARINPLVMTHWISTDKTALNGCLGLIIEFLKKTDAICETKNNENEMRKDNVAKAKFLSEIAQYVFGEFSADSIRYKYVKDFLSNPRLNKGLIGKVALKGFEDVNRDCCRPRTKYYLIKP